MKKGSFVLFALAVVVCWLVMFLIIYKKRGDNTLLASKTPVSRNEVSVRLNPGKIPTALSAPVKPVKAHLNLTRQTKTKVQSVQMDLKNAVLVDKNNHPHTEVEMETVKYDRDNIHMANLNFQFRDERGSGIYQSGGLLDFNAFAGTNRLNLRTGSAMEVLYPVDGDLDENSIAGMNIYSFDQQKQQWVYESAPQLVTVKGRKYFKFDVTHFSYWNIDMPIREHACVRGIVKITDSEEKIPVHIIAKGKSYSGTTQITVTNGDAFALDVKKDSVIQLMAYSGANHFAVKDNFRVGNRAGSSTQPESYRNYYYDSGELMLSKEGKDEEISFNHPENIDLKQDNITNSSDKTESPVPPIQFITLRLPFPANSFVEAVNYKNQVVYVHENSVYIIGKNGELIHFFKTENAVKITPPVIYNNIILFGDEKGYLYAYNFDGERLWENGTAGAMVFYNRPAVGENKVLTVSVNGGANLFDLNGALLTQLRSPEKQFFSSPLIPANSDIAVFGDEHGWLYAYNIDNYNQQWQKKIADQRILYPLLGNKYTTVVFLRKDENIYGIDTVSGHIKWQKTVPPLWYLNNNSLSTDGKYFSAVNNERDNIYVFEIESGKTIMSKSIAQISTKPLFYQNRLYIGTADGTIYCFDLQNGESWFKKGVGMVRHIYVDKGQINVFVEAPPHESTKAAPNMNQSG